MDKKQVAITILVFAAVAAGIVLFVLQPPAKPEAAPSLAQAPQANVVQPGSQGAKVVQPEPPKDTPEKKFREALERFMSDQAKGSYGDWCEDGDRSLLFAVRGWTVIDVTATEDSAFFKVRIDSSNKGGQQITALWTIWMVKQNGKYCAKLMRDQS